MNVKESSKLIGRTGHYSHRELSGLRISVFVEDVRQSYGHVELYVHADKNDVGHWVRLDSVTFPK